MSLLSVEIQHHPCLVSKLGNNWPIFTTIFALNLSGALWEMVMAFGYGSKYHCKFYPSDGKFPFLLNNGLSVTVRLKYCYDINLCNYMIQYLILRGECCLRIRFQFTQSLNACHLNGLLGETSDYRRRRTQHWEIQLLECNIEVVIAVLIGLNRKGLPIWMLGGEINPIDVCILIAVLGENIWYWLRDMR